MRSRRVCLALIGLCGVLAQATFAQAAPPTDELTDFAPYLAKAKEKAATWQADAKLYELRVTAEADGSVILANMSSSENPVGRQVLAFFHSASAAKRMMYTWDASSGEWLDAGEAPMPPDEGVVVIPERAPDWTWAVMVGKSLGTPVAFGAFKNSDDNCTVGILRGYWDPKHNAHEAVWTIVGIENQWLDGMKVTKPFRPRTRRSEGNDDRKLAVSERGGEHDRDEFSLLGGLEGEAQTVTDMTPLGRLPDPATGPLNLEVTLDGMHWYYVANGVLQNSNYVAKDDAGVRVVVDGVASIDYDEIGTLIRSLKGGHILYAAKRSPQWSMVYDGEEFPVGEPTERTDVGWRSVSAVRLSEDGAHWACAVTQPHRDATAGWYLEDTVYVDGAPVEPVLRRAPGVNATVDEERMMYLLDGVADVEFSPDGSQWAFSYEGTEGTKVYVQGKPPSPRLASIGTNTMRYTPDGALLWVEVTADGSTLWRDGAAVARVPGDAYILEVSADGKRVALSCDTDEGEAIHVVGTAEPVVFEPHEFMDNFVFSPDSQHCAAAPWDDDGTTVMFDGKAVRTGTMITAPQFMPDGRLVYGVQETGKPTVLVVGEQETPTEFDEIEWVQVTPTGSVAYLGKRNDAPPATRAALVIHGEVADLAAEFFKVAFPPDGKSAVYDVTRTPNGASVPCFQGVDQPRAPLLAKFGEGMYFGGNLFVVDGPDSAHYISLYEDGRVALARVHPRSDRPSP